MRKLAVAVLANAVIVAVAACDGAEPEGSRPTRSIESSQVAAVDVDVSSVPGRRLALAGLPPGPPPGVPWVEGGTLHVGARTLELPRVRTSFQQSSRRVVPYGSGAIMELSDYGPSVIVTVAASGQVVRRRPGTALGSGPDGRVTWWDARNREVVVADGTSGRELRRETGPDVGASDELTAVGWLNQRDVVFRVGHSWGAYLWSTSGEDLQWWRGAAFAISPTERLAAVGFWGGTGADNECAMVGDVLGGRPLWRHCLWRGELAYWSGGSGAFSPDGRLLLVTGGSQTFGARPFHVLLDARTGDPLARYDHGRYGDDRVGAMYEVHDFAFEDDDHVLFVVADRTGRRGTRSQVAIVRCDVDTACELATQPRPYRWRGEGEQRPYGLAH